MTTIESIRIKPQLYSIYTNNICLENNKIQIKDKPIYLYLKNLNIKYLTHRKFPYEIIKEFPDNIVKINYLYIKLLCLNNYFTMKNKNDKIFKKDKFKIKKYLTEADLDMYNLLYYTLTYKKKLHYKKWNKRQSTSNCEIYTIKKPNFEIQNNQSLNNQKIYNNFFDKIQLYITHKNKNKYITIKTNTAIYKEKINPTVSTYKEKKQQLLTMIKTQNIIESKSPKIKELNILCIINKFKRELQKTCSQ